MKELQNDFTSPEQSKRLLELGVPADSADHYYPDYGSIPMVVWTLTQPRDLRRGILKPCWSAGRLIEIMALCYEFDIPGCGSVQIYATDVKKGNVIDVLISDIERFINKIDFSKLEE